MTHREANAAAAEPRLADEAGSRARNAAIPELVAEVYEAADAVERSHLIAQLLRPLVWLGQLALTAYVAHLVLGEQWLWDWQADDRPTLLTQLAVVGLVVAVFATVASLWRARFSRGPLEAALRVASG